MNIVFKMLRLGILGLVVLGGLGAPVHAQGVYFTARDLLSDFFRRSEAVTYQQVNLCSADRARVKAQLGYEPARPTYTFFVARSADKIDGYALIDEENGEHLPITFAVKISPTGVVERQEIVAYREARGDEVRDLGFRKQFIGKSAADPVAAERDIAVVSGATISSRAMAMGVKRALVLFDMFVRPRGLASARAATPVSGKL